MDAQTPLPLKRITIFKNGTCLVTREGKVPTKDGLARLPIPADVLFGGYWLGAVNNALEALTFKTDKLEQSSKSKDIGQFLSGNIGKKLTVVFHAKELSPISGQLVSYDGETGLVQVKQENGKTTLLTMAVIHQVEFGEEMVNTHVMDSFQRMVLIKPTKPTNELHLQQLSMQAGINWVPSYLLKLKDDKSARLEMKAVIENGVEDLVQGETELVVGAPQMYFGQRRDPITYDYLTEGGHAGESGMATQMLSNSMRSREMLSSPSESAFDSEYVSEGEKTGDLFIYNIGKISLAKGSKGSYPVFATPVEYVHKYEAVIPDQTNFISNRYIQPGETPLDVIHSLTLTNTASVPLTTAPVMVVTEKEQFLAQDLLKYTPVGGQVDIKLSKALDIGISHSEEEVERKDEAKKTFGYNYGRVLIRGTITLSNRQKKETTVSVKKTVSGNITKIADGGKSIKERMTTDNNPVSVMTWAVKLPANGSKTLLYDYEVFFRQ